MEAVMRQRQKQIKVICVLLLVILSGCASRQPIFKGLSFSEEKIDEIFVLPVVDSRLDQKEEINLDKWVHKKIKWPLKRKKYSPKFISDRKYIQSYEEIDFMKPNKEWIGNLGPSDARFLMFFVLHDVSTKLTFGSSGNAEMSGYFFDKLNGSILWFDKAAVQKGQGGLAGMLMKGMMAQTAIEGAAIELIKSFPKNKK